MSRLDPVMAARLLAAPGLTPEHRLAVQLLVNFLDLFPAAFPKRRPPHRIPNPDKDIRQTYLFGCCLKAAKQVARHEDRPHPRTWVVAQFAVLRAVKDADIMVNALALCGEPAERRWKVWRRHARRSQVKADTTVQLPPVVASLERSHRVLAARVGGLEGGLADGTVRRLAEAGKVDPLYLYLHQAVQAFAGIHGWAAAGVNPERVKWMDTPAVREAFGQVVGGC